MGVAGTAVVADASAVTEGEGVTWTLPGTVSGNGVFVGADPPSFPLQALRNMKVRQIIKIRFGITNDTDNAVVSRYTSPRPSILVLPPIFIFLKAAKWP